MPKFRDLTGQQYGAWTVVSFLGKGIWNCVCECGKEAAMDGRSITSGNSTRCKGCPKRPISSKMKNLVGESFGRLTVVSLVSVEKANPRSALWECLCSCGSVKIAVGSDLRGGKAKSCGCLMLEMSIETMNKVNASGVMLGEGNPAWKGGITPLKKLIRECPEYYKWRSLVFERDNYSCQVCHDQKGGNLHAHHIKLFADILQEFDVRGLEEAKFCGPLWDIDNGMTLCKLCHELVHSSYFHTIC